MKKVVLSDIKKIDVLYVSRPRIEKDTDVLIRMTVVGVCGSDIHYFDTGKIGSQVVEYPFTVGHEGAGVVEGIGEKVKNIKVGDRIAVEPAIACGTCDQCLQGRPHTCRKNKFLGCPGQIEGNLQEYLVLPETQCIKLDDRLTPDDGANSEPLSIGLYANKIARLNDDDRIGILGFGPIGMSVMLMAKARGLNVFYVTEKIPERGKMASLNGATWVGNPLKQDVVQEVEQQEPLLLDAVFECCGDQEALDNAVAMVKPGGKVIIVGIPKVDRWSFSADFGRRKEITLINCRRQNQCVDETLALMASGAVDANAMVTHRFNLQDSQKAFDLVSSYSEGVMKAMIDFPIKSGEKEN